MTATYRSATDTTAASRDVEIDRPDYEGCYAVARAEVGQGELLLYVRVERA